MKKSYTFVLLLMAAIPAISQQKITDQVTIPLYTQNQQGITESPIIMVHKGNVFNIEANFIAPVKKTLLSKILKGAGAAAVAYQSEQIVQHSIEKNNEKGSVPTTNINKNNWLLPLGATIAVTADKLLPKATMLTTIRYQLFNNKNELVSTTQVPVTNTKKTFVISDKVTESGYLKVQFINNQQKPVNNGNIKITVAQPTLPESEDEQQRPYLEAKIITPETPTVQTTEENNIIIPKNLPQILPAIAVKQVVATKPAATVVAKQTPVTATAKEQETNTNPTPNYIQTTTTTITTTTTKTITVVNGIVVSSSVTTTTKQTLPAQPQPLLPIEAILPKRIKLPPEDPIDGDDEPYPDDDMPRSVTTFDDESNVYDDCWVNYCSDDLSGEGVDGYDDPCEGLTDEECDCYYYGIDCDSYNDDDPCEGLTEEECDCYYDPYGAGCDSYYNDDPCEGLTDEECNCYMYPDDVNCNYDSITTTIGQPSTPACFFDSFNYINKLMGGNSNESDIENMFEKQFGTSWKTTGGVTPQEAFIFASEYLDVTTAANFPATSWSSYLDNGGLILTVIDSGFGDGTKHAVTITDYNATNNTYTYYDATLNKTVPNTPSSTFYTNILSVGINGTCLK